METDVVTKSVFKKRDVLFVIHHDDSKLDIKMYLADETKYKNTSVVNSKLSPRQTRDKVQSISRKCCCVVKFGENYKIYYQKGSVKCEVRTIYRKNNNKRK